MDPRYHTLIAEIMARHQDPEKPNFDWNNFFFTTQPRYPQFPNYSQVLTAVKQYLVTNDLIQIADQKGKPLNVIGAFETRTVITPSGRRFKSVKAFERDLSKKDKAARAESWQHRNFVLWAIVLIILTAIIGLIIGRVNCQ